MSGVLDRMVKLARGVLPTVQPLTAPRYAPPVGAHTSIFAESEAPAEAGQNSRRNRARLNEARENMDGRSLAESESVVSANERPQAPMRNRMEARRDRSSSQEFDGRAPSETSIPETVAARPSKETTVSPKQKRSMGESAIAAREHEVENLADTKGSSPKREEDEAESAAPATSARLSPVERTELAMEVKTAARMERMTKEQAAQEAPQQASPESRTEISISIGSIELRAPRVEASPRQAPFRPQVTLDDFLRRKPEAGA